MPLSCMCWLLHVIVSGLSIGMVPEWSLQGFSRKTLSGQVSDGPMYYAIVSARHVLAVGASHVFTTQIVSHVSALCATSLVLTMQLVLHVWPLHVGGGSSELAGGP